MTSSRWPVWLASGSSVASSVAVLPAYRSTVRVGQAARPDRRRRLQGAPLGPDRATRGGRDGRLAHSHTMDRMSGKHGTLYIPNARAIETIQQLLGPIA